MLCLRHLLVYANVYLNSSDPIYPHITKSWSTHQFQVQLVTPLPSQGGPPWPVLLELGPSSSLPGPRGRPVEPSSQQPTDALSSPGPRCPGCFSLCSTARSLRAAPWPSLAPTRPGQQLPAQPLQLHRPRLADGHRLRRSLQTRMQKVPSLGRGPGAGGSVVSACRCRGLCSECLQVRCQAAVA